LSTTAINLSSQTGFDFSCFPAVSMFPGCICAAIPARRNPKLRGTTNRRTSSPRGFGRRDGASHLPAALPSSPAQRRSRLSSWLTIFSRSPGSAACAILPPSAWIISTVALRSSRSRWSSFSSSSETKEDGSHQIGPAEPLQALRDSKSLIVAENHRKHGAETAASSAGQPLPSKPVQKVIIII